MNANQSGIIDIELKVYGFVTRPIYGDCPIVSGRECNLGQLFPLLYEL